MENIHTVTTYPLNIPNNNPKALSIDPTPVHVTALLKAFFQKELLKIK